MERKEVMTINEFAQATGLKSGTVRKLLKEERLISFKIGNRYYINYPLSINAIWSK